MTEYEILNAIGRKCNFILEDYHKKQLLGFYCYSEKNKPPILLFNYKGELFPFFKHVIFDLNLCTRLVNSKTQVLYQRFFSIQEAGTEVSDALYLNDAFLFEQKEKYRTYGKQLQTAMQYNMYGSEKKFYTKEAYAFFRNKKNEYRKAKNNKHDYLQLFLRKRKFKDLYKTLETIAKRNNLVIDYIRLNECYSLHRVAEKKDDPKILLDIPVRIYYLKRKHKILVGNKCIFHYFDLKDKNLITEYVEMLIYVNKKINKKHKEHWLDELNVNKKTYEIASSSIISLLKNLYQEKGIICCYRYNQITFEMFFQKADEPNCLQNSKNRKMYNAGITYKEFQRNPAVFIEFINNPRIKRKWNFDCREVPYKKEYFE